MTGEVRGMSTMAREVGEAEVERVIIKEVGGRRLAGKVLAKGYDERT